MTAPPYVNCSKHKGEDVMNDTSILNHSHWECKYHIVWIPKYRRKVLFGQLRKYLGQIFRELAQNRECEILEGQMMPDHVHILISIPPKYSVAQVVGYIKGKSAIHIARNYLGQRQNFTGQQFWAGGYHVSTVGRDEKVIREYIKTQEVEDQRLEQLNLFK
jgi:putative transposase